MLHADQCVEQCQESMLATKTVIRHDCSLSVMACVFSTQCVCVAEQGGEWLEIAWETEIRVHRLLPQSCWVTAQVQLFGSRGSLSHRAGMSFGRGLKWSVCFQESRLWGMTDLYCIWKKWNRVDLRLILYCKCNGMFSGFDFKISILRCIKTHGRPFALGCCATEEKSF